MELLLVKGADTAARDLDGRTPLEISMGRKDWRVMKLLLTHGADPEVMDAAGHTLLMRASIERCLRGVELLIKAGGANIHAVTDEGETALLFASERGYTDVLELLVAHSKTKFM